MGDQFYMASQFIEGKSLFATADGSDSLAGLEYSIQVVRPGEVVDFDISVVNRYRLNGMLNTSKN
jgi:hypothetical protein